MRDCHVLQRLRKKRVRKMDLHLRDTRILNNTQLQRIKDAKKLAETRLQGMEESLSRLQVQQQWLRRYSQTVITMEREKKRLFELGKQKAALAKDAELLERYDLFEGIHGIYKKLSVINEQIGQDKRGLSFLEQESNDCRQKNSNQEKCEQQAKGQLMLAKTNLLDVTDHIFTASQLTGCIEAIDAESDFLLASDNKVTEEMNALSSLAKEKEKNVSLLSDELERLHARRQSIEIHENMVRHGEAVLLQLNNLNETARLQANIQQQSQQTLRRQEKENEMLQKTYAQYQDLVSRTDSIEAELNMHRSFILGKDDLTLQERALKLKGRRQMLHSALSLWKRISTGFEHIEEKKREVTALRMQIHHLEDNVCQLEAETGKLQRLCKEKEYVYLLSKGQDIIQMRANLREGTSCSVCGAVHHPYHSDTIADQGKLIGEMKTDYELLASESDSVQQRLSEMKTNLSTAHGQLIANEEILNTLRIRQNEDMKEWKLYAELDPTFAECSESTNLEARMTLIRQFIENVSRDAEDAEKELETFTFHQGSIARLGEELQRIEQQKEEINVRFGELNTGCQVLCHEAKQLGQRLENVSKRFTRIYENMQLCISIKDWYMTWQDNPGQVHDQIQKLINDWHSIGQEIAEKQTACDAETARLENIRMQLQLLTRISAAIDKRQEDLNTRKAESLKTYGQMIPGCDIKALYQKHLQSVTAAEILYEAEHGKTCSTHRDTDIVQGRHDCYISHIERLENEKKRLCEQLDLWIHGFNKHHPPVQTGELDAVFADGKDWSQIRSSLKHVNNETLLCQAKIDELNSRIIALELEEGNCNPQTPDIQEAIAGQQQALVKQRRDTMMQIAKLSLQLEDHEKALAAERNSAETDAGLA